MATETELHKKKGLPEEDELVLCKVTNIQYNSVFAELVEYDIVGMIHISEISPGRIRNIRDFVKEGKVIVCKVLRVKADRNQIDLSLRRVTDSQRRQKVNEIKQEQICEKIIEQTAKKLGRNVKSVFDEIRKATSAKYDSIYHLLEDVVMDETTLAKEGVNKEIAAELEPIVKQRLKKPEVKIEGVLVISSYASDGVEIIKKAAELFHQISVEKMEINYLGAGKFKVDITSEDYKTAEKILKDAENATETFMKKNQGNYAFERIEKD